MTEPLQLCLALFVHWQQSEEAHDTVKKFTPTWWLLHGSDSSHTAGSCTGIRQGSAHRAGRARKHEGFSPWQIHCRQKDWAVIDTHTQRKCNSMGGLRISCSQHTYLHCLCIKPKMKPPFYWTFIIGRHRPWLFHRNAPSYQKSNKRPAWS